MLVRDTSVLRAGDVAHVGYAGDVLPSPRTDSAHRALTAVIAVAPLGLLGGLAVYTALFRAFSDDVDGPPARTPSWLFLALSAVVMVLSMAAASVAGAPREPDAVAPRAFGVTTIAACACAAVTWTPVILGAWLFDPSSATFGPVVLGIVLVAVIGAAVGFFVGLPFAIAYTMLLRGVATARDRAGYAHEPAVWLVVSAAWASAGALFAACSDRWQAPGLAVAMVGVVLACAALARVVRLARWLGRVRRGDVHGYRTEPARADDSQLPLLLPFFTRGAVLLRVAREGEGPFRTVETATRLARC